PRHWGIRHAPHTFHLQQKHPLRCTDFPHPTNRKHAPKQSFSLWLCAYLFCRYRLQAVASHIYSLRFLVSFAYYGFIAPWLTLKYNNRISLSSSACFITLSSSGCICAVFQCNYKISKVVYNCLISRYKLNLWYLLI